MGPILGAQVAAAFYSLLLSGDKAEEDERQALEKEAEVVNVKSAALSAEQRV